jgi:hypothetical protein
MGARSKRTIAGITMLNPDLWTSFEKALSKADIEKIEGRLGFLRDTLQDAATQYYVEDVCSELDLNLHIYLKYFELSGGTELTPWLIHDAWFNYYSDGHDLNPILDATLREVFVQSETDLHLEITGLLKCLNSDHMIIREVDAVVWLSFLDYMASRVIHHIGRKRMQRLFTHPDENALSSS